MSTGSNIAKNLFKKMQDTTAGSKKLLLKFCHKIQNVLPSPIIKKKLDIYYDRIGPYEYFIASKKNNKKNNDKCVIYVHGGGFVFQITEMHWKHIERIARATGASVYVPNYPLSTENYSSQEDTNKFLMELYKKILETNKFKSITIMGDSAGGNFALVLAQQVKVNKLRTADNIILISPCLSFVMPENRNKKFTKEVIFTKNFFYTIHEWQLRNNSPKNPMFSPTFGDSKDIGKIYLFSASDELFTYQVQEYCDRLAKEGIWYSVEIWKGLFHDFPLSIYPKEAIKVNKKIFDIINGKINL
ncbi:MAG: hypothetical protein Ta2E_02180 [Mycoplasmoidaceae bacterium]|nr:MAG: hypothetical protein Ta2E_02180 [Mycoplasmoidaceae bacterium]